MNTQWFRIVFIVLIPFLLFAQNRKKFIEKHYSFETAHFILTYEVDLENSAREIATILEKLYPIYRNKYGITLPKKTEVLVLNSAFSGGWALTTQNTIAIWVNELDWNMRGSPDWLENVVAHEYAHIVSISASYKMPYWMPYFQAGTFSHPNEKSIAEVMYIYPSDILPPWFFEGIAQYESYLQDGDSWDSHRDMILRRLVLTDSLLSWDHMSVFTGRADDYEKVYNHGFLMVKYIVETYGEDKIPAIIRESSRFGRLIFDNSIKAVLGISGRQLYADWKQYLKTHYAEQLIALGDTTPVVQISEKGFDNFWPRITPDQKRILFLSNNDYHAFYKQLYSYSLVDTTNDSNRIRLELPMVNYFYDVDTSKTVIFSSAQSLKSQLPHDQGSGFVYDIHTAQLPADTAKPKRQLYHDKQMTTQKGYHGAVFSPDGGSIAAISHQNDRHYLTIGNRNGHAFREVYPPKDDDLLKIQTIYSLDWSPDGVHIAMSYMDHDHRKIGIFNIETRQFTVLSDTLCDDRDPRFSRDGKTLYFASDRSGIFNIYRLRGKHLDTLEQMTNVVSGAFTPDISADESLLVFAGYGSNGYAIYGTDSIAAIASSKPYIVKSALRVGIPFEREFVSGSRKNYSYFPRKLLVIPTILSEEVIANTHNPYEGIRHTKYGAIVGLMDPLSWAGKGNLLQFFYLTGDLPRQLTSPFTDLSRNLTVPYDLGITYESQIFPVDISLFYLTRNIPTENQFIHNMFGYDTLVVSDYSIQPSFIQASLSRSIITQYPTTHVRVGAFFSYTNHRLQVRIDENDTDDKLQYLWYDPADLLRFGALATYSTLPRYSPTTQISPRGFTAKLQWDFNRGQYANAEEVLKIEDGKITENVESYNFHSLRARLFWGKPSWLISDKVDFALQLGGIMLKPTSKTQKQIQENHAKNPHAYPATLPDFFWPVQKVPGYSYFYRADSSLQEIVGSKGDTTYVKMSEDSIVASNQAMIEAHMSYRFPLSSGPINKKVWFLYLDKIYGAVNGGAVLPLESFRSIVDKSIDDALIYAGAEVRLNTIAFNNYPMAIGFRWDHGFNRAEPVGGNRFTFSLGFAFNNWTIVEEPDAQRYTPALVRQQYKNYIR